MKAKKNYGYGRLEEILTPSPNRVEPECAFARQCGGCQLQALSYEKQLEFKTSKVRGHLERIGGFTDIPMEKISELLKKAPTDDGTFYGSLYDLYVFIGLVKSADDIKNGRTITLEELKKEMEALYDNSSKRFG